MTTRCRTCVYPTTKPDLAFDETGQCSACTNYFNRPKIDWAERKKELIALLDRHDGKCIVPSSGGKDSHYQVLTLLDLGADITIVTARTCMLTEIGRKNIDNLARYARTIEVVPNMKARAKLNRLGLEMVGDISWAEHVAIFTTPFRMAMQLGIPLLFYGENPQNQYGGPVGSERTREMTARWVFEFGGFLGLRASDVQQMGFDMRDYTLPEPFDPAIEAHFLGQYLPWDSHQNAAVAEKAGMIQQHPHTSSWWYFENQDNAQTGIHDYFMYLKYGYGRGCAQISVDVRAGLVSREEALAWVELYDGIFPEIYMGVHFRDVLEHIGMSRDQFFDICARYLKQPLTWDGL